MADEQWRNFPDASEDRGRKFKRACEIVEDQYDDRWPARGMTRLRSGDWRPLDEVSLEGRRIEYKKRPNAKG